MSISDRLEHGNGGALAAAGEVDLLGITEILENWVEVMNSMGEFINSVGIFMDIVFPKERGTIISTFHIIII